MKKIKFILFATVIYLHIGIAALAQNVGINPTGTTPDASAMLDVSATDKGMLVPRVNLLSNTDMVTIANPATSLLVYNTNANMSNGSVGFYYWNGTAWVKLNDGVSTGSNNLWTASGNNISNTNTGHVGINITTPQTPLHVTGQHAITIPNGGTSTAHITTMVHDTAIASGTDSKIGIYSSIKNHFATNVGILTECISNNNANNYGLISSVSNDPGATGSACAIAAVDLVKSQDLRTFALKIDGNAQYAGVPNSTETGTILTNAGNGLMKWSMPTIFKFFDTYDDTINSNQSKNVRFVYTSGVSNTASLNTNNGVITITEPGFYHINISYLYNITGPITTEGNTHSTLVKNGNTIPGGRYTQRFVAHIGGIYNAFGHILNIFNINTQGDLCTMNYTTDVFCNVGDELSITHENVTDGNQKIYTINSTITGYIIR